MTQQMVRTLVASILLLPVITGAQSLPYSMVMAIQETAEALGKVDGIACDLRAHHTKSEDERPFKLFLESPEGKRQIEVTTDGIFRLPLLPKGDWDRSVMVHTLEKGDLSLTFNFHFNGQVGSEHATIFDYCENLAEKFRKLDGLREKLARTMPDFAEAQVAIVGITFPREKPATGKALLKRGELTAASIDFSQTGAVTWMFDQYDPKTHRLVWEMKNDEPAGRSYMVFKSGSEAQATKGAIFLWKTEKGAGQSGRTKDR